MPLRRLLHRATRRRRLAVLDTHFPWLISGFRYHEAEELLRQRPDTLFFSLHRLTDPFPAFVHDLADFPSIAPASGVTDVHMVFLTLAAAVLGLNDLPNIPPVPPGRRDLSLVDTFRRWNMRTHVTLYPGGGQYPHTDPQTFRELAARCTTVFTTVPEVLTTVERAVKTQVPVPADFYGWRDRSDGPELRLVFVGDDRPRKGLAVLLDAAARLRNGFTIDVVGPHDRHVERLRALGMEAHGWLPPEALRALLERSDVVVAPASRDLPEDGYGDEGLVDGFPTTSARVAMLTGCCLVGSNPLGDHTMIRPGLDYVEVGERDPSDLADALLRLRAEPERRRRIAASGARAIREHCDVRAVVSSKLGVMGLARRRSG
jgi:glycosyltransferase involved in cell wall biosynthesis